MDSLFFQGSSSEVFTSVPRLWGNYTMLVMQAVNAGANSKYIYRCSQRKRWWQISTKDFYLVPSSLLLMSEPFLSGSTAESTQTSFSVSYVPNICYCWIGCVSKFIEEDILLRTSLNLVFMPSWYHVWEHTWFGTCRVEGAMKLYCRFFCSWRFCICTNSLLF